MIIDQKRRYRKLSLSVLSSKKVEFYPRFLGKRVVLRRIWLLFVDLSPALFGIFAPAPTYPHGVNCPVFVSQSRSIEILHFLSRSRAKKALKAKGNGNSRHFSPIMSFNWFDPKYRTDFSCPKTIVQIRLCSLFFDRIP